MIPLPAACNPFIKNAAATKMRARKNEACSAPNVARKVSMRAGPKRERPSANFLVVVMVIPGREGGGGSDEGWRRRRRTKRRSMELLSHLVQSNEQ